MNTITMVLVEMVMGIDRLLVLRLQLEATVELNQRIRLIDTYLLNLYITMVMVMKKTTMKMKLPKERKVLPSFQLIRVLLLENL